jgi:hypothetical protein
MALAGSRLDVVPITLFVLAEAPYRPSSYPFGFIDDDLLEWDRSTSSAYYSLRSNYDDLANDVMKKDGKTWLVESAMIAELAGGGTRDLPTPGLYEAYETLCAGGSLPNVATRNGSSTSPAGSSSSGTSTRPPCLADAGIADAARRDGSTGDGGVADGGDAGDDDGGDASFDASIDASTFDAGEEEDAGPTTGEGSGAPRCKAGSASDYAIATRDVVGTPQIWVTRLRARIQPNALVDDLALTPAIAPNDKAIYNLHQVARYDDEDGRPSKRSCAASKVVRREKRAPAGTWALGAAAALALTAWLRRKKRR